MAYSFRNKENKDVINYDHLNQTKQADDNVINNSNLTFSEQSKESNVYRVSYKYLTLKSLSLFLS